MSEKEKEKGGGESSAGLSEADKQAIEEALGGVMVDPKTDCPHIFRNVVFPKDPEKALNVARPCATCGPDVPNSGENWINLKDLSVQCSRYQHGHALEHWEKIRGRSADNNHGCIVLSFADLSFFCYACDSYIKHAVLNPFFEHAHRSKFGEDPPSSKDGVDGLADQLEQSTLEEEEEEEERPADLPPEPTAQDIARGLASGEFTKVVVVSGAGLSTAAGIPDFRSPKTGLYANLEKYNLPHPTAIFEIGFFKENPAAFYTLAKELLPGRFRPTCGHIFLRLLSEKGILLRNYTQNIDNLELAAGLPEHQCIECHGSFKTASCASCKAPFDTKELSESILAGRVQLCPHCEGPVKPDIVFFGEALPYSFLEHSDEDLAQADLVIVIGTSLRVSPVSYLPARSGENVKRLFINRESLMDRCKRGKWNTTDVELLGDLQEEILELVSLCGWKDDFKTLYKSVLGEELQDSRFPSSSSSSSSSS